jgi:hypothetical protein
MQKSSINPKIYQQMLECAANAAHVGQSQFFTPVEFGRHCATALPRLRPVLVDPNCGAGHLLQASAPNSSSRLLGADIDPCDWITPKSPASLRAPLAAIAADRLTSCLTRLLPVLTEVGFSADCFVLNPPWRLYLHRHLLGDLEHSEQLAVRAAFAGVEEGAPSGTIDSTIAMLCLALHLCSDAGEGFLIANNNTLQRLIFYPGAPHRALREHIWLRLAVPGNPMTGLSYANFQRPDESGLAGSSSSSSPASEGDFHTGIIYFARATGPVPGDGLTFKSLEEFYARDLQTLRTGRGGVEVRNEWNTQKDTVDLWTVARNHLAELNGRKPRVPYNLWLDKTTGQIHTDLSKFDQVSRKIQKRNLKALFELNGRSPMELVLQRASREQLLELAERAGWRVHPDLLAAVHAAIADYHGQRAPLYPLNETQRLGYLDEESLIVCQHDLAAVFKAGLKYPLRSQSVKVTRKVKKPNSFTGQEDELEYTGQELAFFIDRTAVAGPEDLATYKPDREYTFMDGKLRDGKTQVDDARRTAQRGRGHPAPDEPIDFTLEQLCRHFVIPEVPDVASVDPQGYQHNLDLLAELEQLTDQVGTDLRAVLSA